MLIILFFIGLLLVPFTICKLGEKLNASSKKLNIICITWLMLFIISWFVQSHFGDKYYGNQIGSIYERDYYTAQYYVNIFESPNASKNYRLVANIERTDDGYRLYSVEWPNGGYLTFENDFMTTLIVDKKVEIYDDSDKTWWIMLTKQKHYSE